jgi:hypothetical protein
MTRCCCLLSKFEMLGSLETQLLLGLTFLTFQTQDDLTGSLCLLVEDGFGLSTETHLLGIVTPFSLGKIRSLTSLVLCHLVESMLLALSLAVGAAFFGDIHHDGKVSLHKEKKKKRMVSRIVSNHTVVQQQPLRKHP